jgi:hypothetical protein
VGSRIVKRRSMKVKPIRSDSDNELALRRVEALWGSPVGSPEGDELEGLVTLIEAYEREHCQIDLQSLAGDDDPERGIKELGHLSGRGHSRGQPFNRDDIHERR